MSLHIEKNHNFIIFQNNCTLVHNFVLYDGWGGGVQERRKKPGLKPQNCFYVALVLKEPTFSTSHLLI